MTKVKLKIADIIIGMESSFALKRLTKREERLGHNERFKNFFYQGKGKPDIRVKVEIVNKLPKIRKTEPLFITYHFQDGKENWRLLKKGNTYIYKSPLENKKQVMLVNENFNRVEAFLLPKKGKGFVWDTSDIIYDFLQVLLINYFAKTGQGVFTHAIGVKDLDGGGLLFAGKSGAGKSTTARLWHKSSRAMVLNDDRIIVRNNNGKFFIYGSPWHGEFSDYLTSRIESAPLKKIFFIHHAKKNRARRIEAKQAFLLLYPALFPTFWDKRSLEKVASFSQNLVSNVPCYRLGFVNDKKIIGFVREVDANY